VNESVARNRLIDLHQAVADRVNDLVDALPGELACRRGCADCCQDGLTVFTVEADLIRHHYRALLAHGIPHAPGACAFLGAEGECRIYPQRPYVCRTQGLPLRWQDEDDYGQTVELRDICPLNEDPLGVPVLALAAEQCWSLGAFEGALASLQAEAQGSFALKRESLRGLFKADGKSV